MGQYVDIVGALSGESQEAGAAEFREYFAQIRGKYLSAFQSIRTQLASCYKSTNQIKKNVDIDTRIEQASAAREAVLQSYPSSKGGADILPEDELERYKKEQEEIAKKRKAALKRVRNAYFSISGTKNINNYKVLAGKMMALIYQLRAELTGTEEQFSFIYSGDSGYAEVINVPVTEFLLNSKLMQSMTLQQSSISRWAGDDDHALRFNNSVLNQMKQIYGGKALGQGNDFMEKYWAAREASYDKIIATKKDADSAMKYIAKNADKGYVYREEAGQYLVINPNAKYQRGFIAQGLFGQYVGDQNATFLGDTRKFYEEADITSASGELFSVKAFIDSQIPSLVSINTLYSASSEIINALSIGETDMGTMAGKLTDIFKTRLAKIDNLANRDIDNVLKKYLTG